MIEDVDRRLAGSPRSRRHTELVPFDFTTSQQRVATIKTLPEGNARGGALENLVIEMFSELPGVEVADRNVLGGTGEAELDILLANEQSESGLPAFGRDVLIECKSSKKPLGSPGVTHFIKQVERRHMPWAVIVSLTGLTGDQDEARAAHSEIRSAAESGTRVLLLAENELAGLRSSEHLAAVIEHKRRKMVGKLRAVTLSDSELRKLDPNAGHVSFTRGVAGIERAIREAHENALSPILDRAAEFQESNGDIDRLGQALTELEASVVDHRANQDEDPLWRGVRDRVIDAGGGFAALLDEDLRDAEHRRIVSFEVRTSAPQRLDAHVGGELWELLADHHLRQMEEVGGHARRRSIMAMLAMCVEEVISIDDIDPRDLFGDEYDT